MEGERAEVVHLLEQQEKYAVDQDEPPPYLFGVDEETRHHMAEQALEGVLVDLLVEILERPKTKGNAKMTEIKIFTDLQSSWERLSSRGARYAIIKDTL
ncbi:hypothetical protein F4776DRAFT_667485 [Hypoxylon sp. NC0597]|nr:hypothetical protein F4776DRAFT_667485 [Hypoxylon sp. NC0597]